MPRLIVHERAILVRLILSQPGMTRAALADEIGVTDEARAEADTPD